MISHKIYCEKIDKLILFKEEPIPTILMLNWLKQCWKPYIEAVDNNSCSFRQSPFPCFCCIKKKDCLFVNIYTKLHIIENYRTYNIKSEKLLIEFTLIKEKSEEVKNWIKCNYDFGINKLCSFDNYNGKKILRTSFINGKNKLKDEFDYINIYVSLKEFEYNYEFKRVFDKLFFIDKILPKELNEHIKEINKIYD